MALGFLKREPADPLLSLGIPAAWEGHCPKEARDPFETEVWGKPALLSREVNLRRMYCDMRALDEASGPKTRRYRS